MFIVVLVEKAPKFKELTKWCLRFKVKCIGNYIASFNDRGPAQALAFIAERHRATTLLFKLNEGPLGLLLAKCIDQRKLFTDFLVRTLHRLGIYVPSTTFHGYPLVVFPTNQHLEEFSRFELHVISNYSEVMYVGPASMLRRKDQEVLAQILRTSIRSKQFKVLMKKAGISADELLKAFNIALA